MNFYKKIACLLLALLLLSFASCSQGGGNKSTESGSGSNSGEETGEASRSGSEWIEELADAENPYKGRSFTVLTTRDAAELFSGENSPGTETVQGGKTPLASAVKTRNELIKQRLGIEIVCTATDDIEKQVRRAAAEGKPCADLICAPESVLAVLAADGLLENLRSLPYVDFNAPYAEKKTADAQTVLNTMYMFSSDLTLPLRSCVGLFYNKALLEGCGTDPETLALHGDFTWGELFAMVQYAAEKGARGITSLLPESELACAIYASAGGKIVTAGAGGPARIAYDAEAAAFTADMVDTLFKSKKYGAQYSEKSAASALKKGELGFALATLDKVDLFDISEKASAGKSPAELKSMEWGLLPLPKRSKAQIGYVGAVTSDAAALAVPRGNTDSGFSGFVLNALLASSTDSVNEALKVTYRNFHFWSNSEALILELMDRSLSFDIGVSYSAAGAVAGVGKTPLGSGKEPTEKAKTRFDGFAKKIFR